MKNLFRYNKRFVREQGFALIEQIIVITIISFLTVAAVVSFTDVTMVQKRRTSVGNLISHIRQIQNYAMTGREDVSGVVPVAYGIIIFDHSTYAVFSDQNGNGLYDDAESVLKKESLPFGLSFFPDKGVLTSLVPNGNFCFFGSSQLETNCDGETDFGIIIESTESRETITVNHKAGDVFYVR